MSEILSQYRRALIAAGVTGSHQSHSRANVLEKIEAVVRGGTDDTFGISGLARHTPAEILEFVARLTGGIADPSERDGNDRIDPDKTVAGLLQAGVRLRGAGGRGAGMLAVTGHPTGLLEMYGRGAAAYPRAGGQRLHPR